MTTTFKVQQRGDDSVALDLPVTEKTGSFTVAPADIGKEFDVNAATAVDANLPSVSIVDNGFNVLIRNSGVNDVTIAPDTGQQIDGQPSLVLGQNKWRWIRSDGAEWKTIAFAAALPSGSVKQVVVDAGPEEASVLAGNTLELASASITVDAGNDVVIMASVGNSNLRQIGTNTQGIIRVYRDTSVISTLTPEFLRGFDIAVFNSYSGVIKDANPGSGTYTYKLEFETEGTGGEIKVGDSMSPHGLVLTEVIT